MKIALITLTILFSGFYSHAQKIKYKDLFVLLRAKNYSDASSFLRAYVAANPEHPNANYQMGLMLEFTIAELDLLKDSDAIVNRADSAIMYFDKAYTYITPKEVKKHDDDYYEFFKRRNLRTGKFEVILSDVQLDIENRKNSLQTKMSNIASINYKFNNSVKFYELARTNYKNLRDVYHNELSLSLGAVDTTVVAIKKLIVQYDSAFVNFKDYKKLKGLFESSSEELIITNSTITDFSKEAVSMPDFYAKKVDFYDFSEWANLQLENIADKKVLIDHLIDLDESLEIIAKTIATDSVDMSGEVFKKITLPVLKELKSIDPESLLTNVFQYKISQLNYNSLVMNWHNLYADSLDIGIQLDFISKLNDQIKSVVNLEAKLHNSDEAAFMLRYHTWLEKRYTNYENFAEYLTIQPSVIGSQEEKLAELTSFVKERDQWGYWNNDSVPISVQYDSLAIYNTFYSDSLENRVSNVVGLKKMEEGNALYFATIPSSRIIDSVYLSPTKLVIGDLNSEDFVIRATTIKPKHTLYLIGALNEDKYNLQMIYFNSSKGIEWKRNITLKSNILPELNFIDHQISIIQGEEISKFQIFDGQPMQE